MCNSGNDITRSQIRQLFIDVDARRERIGYKWENSCCEKFKELQVCGKVQGVCREKTSVCCIHLGS